MLQWSWPWSILASFPLGAVILVLGGAFWVAQVSAPEASDAAASGSFWGLSVGSFKDARLPRSLSRLPIPLWSWPCASTFGAVVLAVSLLHRLDQHFLEHEISPAMLAAASAAADMAWTPGTAGGTAVAVNPALLCFRPGPHIHGSRISLSC